MILGVDPGLVNTGWAVLKKDNNALLYVASGTIKTEANQEMHIRLKTISDDLKEVFNQFSVSDCAIEETFVNKNNLSSLKLGQARGAILLTLANEGLAIGEYSATNIKKSIVGAGRASKEQVEMMVKVLIPKATPKNDHEADAIAVAICHSYSSKLNNLIKAAS